MCHWSESLAAAAEQAASDRRARRHAADLSVLTAAESVLRTSVSAVTFVSTYDRTTDNHISATSSSKSTDYHKQESKQASIRTLLRSKDLTA